MKHFTLLITVLLLASCSTQQSNLIKDKPFEIYDVWQEQQAVFIEFSFEAPYANEYIIVKDGQYIQNGTAIFSPLILWFLPEGEIEIKMRRLGVGEWVSVNFEVME